MPVTIRLLPVAPHEADFHDFEDFERLIDAAQVIGPNAHLAVLLGGEAGLRCSEMMALEWSNVEFSNRQIVVSKSEWRGMVTVPKGGRSRRIPMTRRLVEALKFHRHLRGPRVLCEPDGKPLTERRVQGFVRRAARKTGLSNISVHVLRRTFCSHLAMKGVAARAIQELAGHKDLMTTQRYMHLSPAAVEEAIRILELPRSVSRFGDILETTAGADRNSEN